MFGGGGGESMLIVFETSVLLSVSVAPVYLRKKSVVCLYHNMLCRLNISIFSLMPWGFPTFELFRYDLKKLNEM